MRLDIYLFENCYFTSRELAKANIVQGNVLVNGKTVIKPSHKVFIDDTIELKQQSVIPYVSAGGLKLKKAIDEFNINCQGVSALDVGASTGGFTDCLLQHGAMIVYAIDVGTNQLASKLKDDKRVVSIENVNIKNLSPQMLNGKQFNLIVADLSFISLTKVIKYFPQFLQPDGEIIALIKPQFEVGQENVGKGGVVKNPKMHIAAIEAICTAALQYNLHIRKLVWSPISNPTKNIEYLALFSQKKSQPPVVNQVVDDTFSERSEFNNI